MSTFQHPHVRPLPPNEPDPRSVAGHVSRRTNRAATEAPPSSTSKSELKGKQPKKREKAASGGADKDEGDSDDEEHQMIASERSATTFRSHQEEISNYRLETSLDRTSYTYRFQRMLSERREMEATNRLRIQHLVQSYTKTAKHNGSFSKMQRVIDKEQIEVAKIVQSCTDQMYLGASNEDWKFAGELLVVRVEREVGEILRSSKFFSATNLEFSTTDPDGNSALLLRTLKALHADGSKSKVARDSLLALMDGSCGLVPEFMKELLDNQRIGVAWEMATIDDYMAWRSTKFQSIRNPARSAAAANKEAWRFVDHVEHVFVPELAELGSGIEIQLLSSLLETFVSFDIPESKWKRIGWHRGISRYGRRKNERLWRYRLATCEGFDSHIVKEQIDGEIIGLWTPDEDIDWKGRPDETIARSPRGMGDPSVPRSFADQGYSGWT